jgi:Family of unknown function (DUF6448)
MKTRFQALFALSIFALLLMPSKAAAHCDTMNGPVVTDAKVALKTGDLTRVLKWVRQADESQIRTAFESTMKVRAFGPEAREFADNYFFETLVRVHREGEGEPYTGLKPAGTEVEPVILRADQALQTGSLETLLKEATSAVSDGIQQRFAKVQQAATTANSSSDEGRRYVAAYVEFIHYVESIHAASAGALHGERETRVERERGHQGR